MNRKRLTKRDVEDLGTAARVVKRLSKYVEDVNWWNDRLEENLAKAVKAGDVTNEQKTMIRYVEDAEKQYDRLFATIRSTCIPGCDCDDSLKESCPAHNRHVVLNMMRGVARGSDFDWDILLELASIGRWEWLRSHGYRRGDVPWNAPPENVLPPPERRRK